MNTAKLASNLDAALDAALEEIQKGVNSDDAATALSGTE